MNRFKHISEVTYNFINKYKANNPILFHANQLLYGDYSMIRQNLQAKLSDLFGVTADWIVEQEKLHDAA